MIINLAILIVALLFIRHGQAEAQNTETIYGKIRPSHLILYFLFLGIGFMLIEVGLLQKFILLLGQPTLTFSVVLFSLLLGGGVGSFLSGHFKGNPVKRVILVSFLIGTMVIIYAGAMPYVFNQSLGADILVRSLIAATLLIPLGLLMGIPFPTGLKIFKQSFERDIGWMWGINGAASVLGSTLAVMFAILNGFTLTLLLGGVSYFIVSFIMLPDKRQLLDKLT